MDWTDSNGSNWIQTDLTDSNGFHWIPMDWTVSSGFQRIPVVGTGSFGSKWILMDPIGFERISTDRNGLPTGSLVVLLSFPAFRGSKVFVFLILMDWVDSGGFQ